MLDFSIGTADEGRTVLEAWNRRTDTALEALRKARGYVENYHKVKHRPATKLLKRIDAILSGSPDYPDDVKELVRAARQFKAECEQGVDPIAKEARMQVDSYGRLSKALAPFQEVK